MPRAFAVTMLGIVSALVGQATPGEQAKLQVWRKGEARELTVTLGMARPESSPTASAAGPDQGRLGLSVRPLTAQEREQAKVAGGVLVEEVAGPAARAGSTRRNALERRHCPAGTARRSAHIRSREDGLTVSRRWRRWFEATSRLRRRRAVV